MKSLFTSCCLLLLVALQGLGQSALFTSDSPRCVGETMHFTPAAAGGNILMESWDFGDGNTATYLPPTSFPVYATHVYASAGTFNVQRSVKFDNTTLVYNLQVQVVPLPLANFSWSTANCAQPPVQFTDLSQPNGGGAIVAWLWNFGDPPSGTNNTSTLPNPAHAFSAPGTYNVMLVITNASGCTDTLIQSVAVNTAPLAGFTADTVCLGEATQFTDLSIANAPAIVSYYWDFGDGGTSTLINPSHTYAVYGTYTVIHIVVNSNGCSDSETKTVTVRPKPIANFSFPATSCLGSPVAFTDLSSTSQGFIVQWTWDFGDGTPPLVIVFPSNPNVIHTFAGMALAHVVRLTVTTSTGCTSYIDKTVTSTPPPLANFMWSAASCQSQTVQFYDLSQNNGIGSIVAWSWNFGDPASGVNNVSALQNPAHAFSTSGSYGVMLVITNNVGCTDTMMKIVTVNIPPVADFTADTVCLGEATQFTDLSIANAPAIVSYYWDFGDGATSTAVNPSHLYPYYGAYQVIHTVTNSNGCSDSETKTVLVKPDPVAAFSFPASPCMGSPVAFTDFSYLPAGFMGFIVKWVWEFGDGTPPQVIQFPNSPNVMHTFAGMAMTHVVRLTVTSSSGCSHFIEHTVTSAAQPVANFTQSDPRCVLQPVQFTDLSQTNGGGSIVAWSWNFGDPVSGTNNASASQNPAHSFSAAGIFNIRLAVLNSNGCSDTIIQPVTINFRPVAVFSADTVVQGNPTHFTDLSYMPGAGVITSWLWAFGDGQTSNAANPSHTYAGPGVYQVSLTVSDQNGCTDDTVKPVLVNPVSGIPATRTVTNVIVGSGETKCYNATQQILVAGNSTLFIVLPGGDATFIAGQQVLFYPGTNVQSGGHMLAYIAPNGPWCVNPSGPEVTEEGEGGKEKGEGGKEKGEGGKEKGEGGRVTGDDAGTYADQHRVRVFPNPTGGEFVLSVDGCSGDVSVGIFDRMGDRIGSRTLEAQANAAWSLTSRPAGIYLVRVTCGAWSETVRIVRW